jgi:putative ABC transport system permease protein
MAPFRRLVLRLFTFLRPGRADRQLEREIASHLALIEDDLRSRGLSPEDARRAARRTFGGVDQTREIQREARSLSWLEDVRRDVRHAIRGLARERGFALAAILTLALGIGGTTAVFSLIDAVLLRPLPFHDADRLVMVFEDNSRSGFPQDVVSPANYGAWSTQNDVFDSVAATTEFGAVLSGGNEPVRVEGRRATRSLFPTLGAAPLLGRVFTGSEDSPGGPLVTILSYGLWQRRFGGDPGVVGRTIRVNDQRYLVVGVMPREFQFFESYVGLWVPAAFTSEELTNGAHYLMMLGRMKPGIEAARVVANLQTIGTRVERQHPGQERWRAVRPVIVPLGERIAGEARRPLLLLLVSVGVVLLIACANLASLLLARGASRRHEIALRGALGASRGRIVRQLLTESLVLSAFGLGGGLLLARWTFSFLEQLVPPAMTLFAHPALDGRTIAVAAGVALVTSALFGLAPAMQAARLAVADALKGGRRTVSSAQGRGALVVAEVALTLVLLVAAGLLLQTFHRMRYTDLGIRPDHVLTLRTALPLERYSEAARRRAFYERVLETVQRLPGVVGAGYTTSVPLEWKGGTSVFAIEGTVCNPTVSCDANHRQVSTAYLQAIGTPLRRGRFFDRRDQTGTEPVVIVNETMAEKYWPGEDVIGRRIRLDQPEDADRWLTIVGVVGDVRQMGLDAPPRPEMYIPYQQIDTQPWFAPRDLVVRGAGDTLSLTGAIKAQIHAADDALAVSNVRTLDEVLDEDVATRRVGTTLLLAFAALAVLLAVVGIYGVIAYFVAQHVPEMGVRIALGAGTGDILRLVIGKGVKLAAAGVGIGTLAALATARLMSSLLYGVNGSGLLPCAVAGGLLLLLALAASYIPGRRATGSDPIVALRAE